MAPRLTLKHYDPTNRARRSRHLADYIIRRDLYFCQCCYASSNLEAHHIHPIAFGGLDESSNMVTLCHECHKFVPHHPEDFYDYQKRGGWCTEKDLGAFLQEVRQKGVVISLEIATEAFYAWRMGNYIRDYQERVAHMRHQASKEEEAFSDRLTAMGSGMLTPDDLPQIRGVEILN